MNLTVAWAPFGGWDPKTEQPGSFAQEAELSRTDSHVNLTRLRASQSLKDFQERLQQLGEGRAADAGEQPQWRADQRPLRTLSRGYRPGGGPAKVPGHGRCTGCILTPEALCPGGGGHGSELKAAPPQEALGPRLSQALSWPTTPPTLALQGSGRTKAGRGRGRPQREAPGLAEARPVTCPACQTLPASANGRHQIPAKTTAASVQEAAVSGGSCTAAPFPPHITAVSVTLV